MNIIAQEARKRQAVVNLSLRKGKSFASRIYGVSLYGFEEHTPENTVKFLKMLIKAFPFRIHTIQTDNGTEFTYKFISDTEESPMDKYLHILGIRHVLIAPRTPWHKGKVERSHRNDQRYFYDCISSIFS